MATPEKSAAVAELAEAFRDSDAAVLTEYRGLSAAQLRQLRRSLGENTSYQVVKNTLTKLAAGEAGVSAFDGLLQGPSAIAFVKGDPVAAAKGLRDFAKDNPSLKVKGGLVEGRPVNAAELNTLADLESREVLLAQLAGVLKASLSGAASLFQAPIVQVGRLADALRTKAEQQDSGATPEPADAEA